MIRHYRRVLPGINRSRRPQFIVGGYVPAYNVHYFTPVPPPVLGYLPPIPPGYDCGYYQGYVVVYDPATYLILNLVDLLM
ncbi:MAG TPA: hypothetical protein VG672_08175 [Bryobacteraceae bacterium]|nr:hypothetical protein [Bryobacteraceae bacterium]